jgi:hypothetical protein
MSTVAQLATEITDAPAPVVFLDTCAILDVARAPARQQSASVAAADALHAHAVATPPKVYLLAADIVSVEWADNIPEARKEMVRTAAEFEHGLSAFRYSLTPMDPPDTLALDALAIVLAKFATERNNFLVDLENRSQQLLNACRLIDRDPSATSAALDRVVAKRRPSHKKEVKDSYILEHCLLVARELAATVPFMLFVSSNTSDFVASKGSTDLHSDLRADFATAGLTYAVSIASAVALLRDGGHIP